MKKRVGTVWFPTPFFADNLDAENVVVKTVDDLNGLDLLVFWGGGDVHPSLYREKNEHSYGMDLNRDKFESFIFNKALLCVPILGICRGAQLSCVLTGGKLWQHVDNHGRDHNIVMKDGTVIKANSTHHQMMIPSKETEILATSEKVLSPLKKTQDGKKESNDPEPEICFNDAARCLMIQGHPEYHDSPAEFKKLTFSLLDKYLGVFR